MSINKPRAQTEYTEQYILNSSYDEDMTIIATEAMEFDPSGTGSLQRPVTPYLPLRLDYDVNSHPIYIGKSKQGAATSDASWRIQKLTWSSDNLIALQYADGNAEFDNVWDDRASLTYI